MTVCNFLLSFNVAAHSCQGWEHLDGKDYMIFATVSDFYDDYTWQGARLTCNEKGADHVTIENEAVTDLVLELVRLTVIKSLHSVITRIQQIAWSPASYRERAFLPLGDDH